MNSIIYKATEAALEKMVFFEIAALHRCQLRLRLKPLVTTRDFN